MIAASILMARALAPVEQAIGSWRSTVAAREAYQRIKAHLGDGADAEAAMPLPAPTGRLEVEGVIFAHPGANEPVLRNVTFALGPGESLGLVGETAAGKTTLARVLVGNLAAQRGAARLDAAELAAWPSDDRGRHIGYLPQDVELFDGTVRENIARMTAGDPDAVVAAAKTAGVHELIQRLPEGYETQIGDGGAVLSGGQRQRIALARALYGSPRLLVLDEPNASLDQAGEAALLEAIRQLKARQTTLIVIAHRPSVLRHVDKILVLRDGAVAVFGPRDEVLQKIAGPSAKSKVVAYAR